MIPCVMEIIGYKRPFYLKFVIKFYSKETCNSYRCSVTRYFNICAFNDFIKQNLKCVSGKMHGPTGQS